MALVANCCCFVVVCYFWLLFGVFCCCLLFFGAEGCFFCCVRWAFAVLARVLGGARAKKGKGKLAKPNKPKGIHKRHP